MSNQRCSSAYVHRNRDGVIDAPSKISSLGIARNLGFRSTKRWSPATGFISMTSCLHLGPSMCGAAVRRLAYEATDAGLLSPDLAAGIRRVKGAKKLGIRLGNWLTVDEARSLWQLPNRNTLKGKRDRAILATLLGCALRRRELIDLTFDHIQRREDHWAIVDLVGKGGHIRTVPMPDWVKHTIDDWLAIAQLAHGKIFRCVCRKGTVWGTEITEKVVWHVVKEYAERLGISKLAPHDLRRSCARFCHDSGGELEQIQFLLGHVSVQTTEKYLGCKQRLRQAVNDRLGIEPVV